MARFSLFKVALALSGLIVLLDQLSKWWILSVFHLPFRGVVEVLPFFNLVMVWNKGMSFGMFPAESKIGLAVLLLIPLIIVGVLIAWLRRAEAWPLALGLGLVIGGAIGNMIDRARFGAVADFVQLHAAGYSFYVFNIADAAISIGVALLLWDAIFQRQDKA